ncbi:hypothetical protein CN481_14215 [Bacillus sp. AFS006103]|nr:hypothetical protein CN481_14215 [Bacillus sp. AFS006103]
MSLDEKQKKDFMKNLLLNKRKHIDYLLEEIKEDKISDGFNQSTYDISILTEIKQQIVGIRDDINKLQGKTVCKFEANSNGEEIHLVTGHSNNANIASKSKSFDELSKFAKSATELIVIDNYFTRDSERFSKNFLQCLDKSTLKTLYIIYNPAKGNRAQPSILMDIYNHLGSQIDVKPIPTHEVHDRVWIVDRSEAKIVGSSLNELGTKLSYILDLTTSDLNDTIDFLKEKKLIE